MWEPETNARFRPINLSIETLEAVSSELPLKVKDLFTSNGEVTISDVIKGL